MSAMKIVFCTILVITLSIKLAEGEKLQPSFKDELSVQLEERKQINNVKSSRLDDLVPKQNKVDESNYLKQNKITEIKSKSIAQLKEHIQIDAKMSEQNTFNMQQSRLFDPILESLILDSSDFLSNAGLYFLAYQHKAANLKRYFGGGGPDYSQGRILFLLQNLEGVLYSAGATIEQIDTLQVSEFTQAMWYRLDFNRQKFASTSSLLYQLTESVNIDYMVPYSTRRPEFLLGVSEEFYYAYMSAVSFMSEEAQQLATWQDVDHIESTALLLASELGIASTEITQYTDEIRSILTAKFDSLNLARTKFLSAAMDAHSSVNGIVLRYNDLMKQSN